jgi:hypothetical protein
MSYKVVKGQEGYNIYEKQSDTTIVLGKSENDIRDICRKLNLGSGFNGWTPSFIAEKHIVKYEEA